MRLRATERQLFESLREFYPPREYALLPQVANGTGLDARRHADAIAMSLWPSRGMHVHGFEMKSSPSDWKRELRNPAKADEIAQYCNYWWVVGGYPGLVKLDELPAGWGLYEYDHEKKALMKRVNAPFRKATVDIGFVAACLRRASEIMTPEAELQKAYEKGLTECRRNSAMEVRHLQESLDGFKKAINDFETVSGVKISKWNAGQIGAAVGIVMTGGAMVRQEKLVQICESVIRELKGNENASS